MGCGHSSSVPLAASKAAWQSFFHLDGLPLSLTVEQVQKNLQLRIVGLDCVEELPLLEAAIVKRDLLIKTATLIKIGSHVDQTFELMPLSRSPVRKYLVRTTLKQEVELRSVSFSEISEAVPQATRGVPAQNFEQVLKLTVECPAKGGERGAIMKMMHSMKYKLICAKLQTDQINGLSDTFYITPDLAVGGYAKRDDLLTAEFKLAVFDQLQKNCSTTSAASKVSTISPDTDMLEHINKKSAQQSATPHLPIVLRELQKTLEYQLHGPVNSGLVINGFRKYVGIGLAQRSLEEMLGIKEVRVVPPLVLEIRTCFVSEKVANSTGQFAEFSRFLHDAIVGTQEFANFVSWLDISERTWTIDRVYLNGILPAGQRYGAQAIAEHLLEPPLLFFQSAAASGPAQIGSFLDSMPDLEKMVISDIVNWNTYLLMAVAGTSEAESNAKVGDVLSFALDTELKAAGLTRHALYSSSILEVFQRTVLGKMAFSALKIWNQKLNRAITMKSAQVMYGQGDEEIFGQLRPRMAVIVQLGEEQSELRAKGRLGTKSTVTVPKELEVEVLQKSEVHAPLEGMGQFFEGAWGASHGRVYAPTLSSGRHYFASLSSAMTCLLHEMQVERGLSCRATAANPTVLATAVDRMQNQRASSDKAFAQLLEILRLAPSLMEQGVIGSKQKEEVFALHQEISVGTLLQRGVVNDAIKHNITSWMGRYEIVCATAETGYHLIVDKLLRGIVKAIGFASEGLNLSAAQARCEFLLRCKEQVGQERGMLAAKGESRWVDDVRAKQLFESTTVRTKDQLELIRKDEVLSRTAENKMLIDALTQMHASYKKEVDEKDFIVPAERVVEWFETLTRWILLAYDHIQTEIEALSEDLPDDNVAQALPDLDLRVKHQVSSPDVSDEAMRQLLSDFRAGRFKKVVLMVGAGISVSANLPDFRSKGGLYDQLRQSTNISSPETIFTREFMRSDPQLFFQVMQKLQADHVNPTLTHEFIKKLQDKGILQRCYTQNIDCLERKVGIQEDLLVECHGTTAKAKCHECKKFFKKDDYFKKNEPPMCSCGGQIRPDIVLFGEVLPESFQTLSKNDFQSADLLVVMGTSLKVQPFASLPKLLKPSCALLVINREFPQSLQLHRQVRALRHSVASPFSGTKLRKHVFLAGDCDTSVRWLMQELKWVRQEASV